MRLLLARWRLSWRVRHSPGKLFKCHVSIAAANLRGVLSRSTWSPQKEEDTRVFSNVQNGLVFFFLFSFILFYSFYSLLFSFILFYSPILFYSLLFSFILFSSLWTKTVVKPLNSNKKSLEEKIFLKKCENVWKSAKKCEKVPRRFLNNFYFSPQTAIELFIPQVGPLSRIFYTRTVSFCQETLCDFKSFLGPSLSLIDVANDQELSKDRPKARPLVKVIRPCVSFALRGVTVCREEIPKCPGNICLNRGTLRRHPHVEGSWQIIHPPIL